MEGKIGMSTAVQKKERERNSSGNQRKLFLGSRKVREMKERTDWTRDP